MNIDQDDLEEIIEKLEKNMGIFCEYRDDDYLSGAENNIEQLLTLILEQYMSDVGSSLLTCKLIMNDEL